ncbi:MAG TPA: UDP-N-acetylglucosamine 2-epimerase (non-hydrolyzing), partial [Thermotogota bacterium]|nr:UDP-N-acetylglucosamine 2-epimerase (non-hydrolyzing) [Thermotogota bacterium]
PDYNLGIGSGSHAYQTGTGMMKIEEIVLKEKPDVLLVHGDTNATIAGALVGAKLKVPVAHVEAGLRQTPKDMPEEINRVVTDHVSRYLFCPTELAVKNLKGEGLTTGVFFTGDVMYDLFLSVRKEVSIEETCLRYFVRETEFFFATLHRDFNTDHPERLKNILEAFTEIAKHYPVILPIHPRTRKAIQSNGFEDYLHNLNVIDPIPYADTVALLSGAKCVITDSGGVQKEAYFAGSPALVMMEDTGWRELVEMGFNALVDADKEKIITGALSEKPVGEITPGLFGNGDAGSRIVGIISKSAGRCSE